MSYFSGVAMVGAAAARDQATGAAGYAGVAPEFVAVLYRPGDPLGLACAFLSVVPPAVLVAHLAVFLARRSALDLWFAGGQVVCEAANGVVKTLIKEPRPPAPVSNMPMDTYGMPSAHSQFMGFVAGYVLARLPTQRHLPRAERWLRAVTAVALAAGVAFSRWYLYYHTAAQVVMGVLLGATLGVFWCALGRLLVRAGVIDWLLTLWPCRLLCVKNVEYDVYAEYAAWQKRRA